MTSFVALYRGASIGEAQMIAVSADPQLVAQVAAHLLQTPRSTEHSETDPVISALDRGRRRALRLVKDGDA